MTFDINEIIKRLNAATGTENDLQLCNYLGRNHGATRNWRNSKKPPLDACLEVSMKTGVDFIWLVTGESKESSIPQNADFQQIRTAFLKSLTKGYEFGYLAHTVKTTNQTLDLMAGMLYEELTGKNMEEVLKKPKQADAG